MTDEQQTILDGLEAAYNAINAKIATKNTQLTGVNNELNDLISKRDEINSWIGLVNSHQPAPAIPFLSIPPYPVTGGNVNYIIIAQTSFQDIAAKIDTKTNIKKNLVIEIDNLKKESTDAYDAVQEFKLGTLSAEDLAAYQAVINESSDSSTRSKFTIYILVGVVGAVVLSIVGWVIYKFVGKSKTV